MPRYVATDRGVGRLAKDQIEILDLPGRSLDQVFGVGVTAQDIAAATTIAVVSPVDVTLGPPCEQPGRLWAVGFAYAEHKAEVGRVAEDQDPFIFLKASSSIVGPGVPIRLPRLAPERVDYEGEVAIVIGKPGYWIAEEDAWKHIFGFTAANDVSARDVQKEGAYNGGASDPPKAKSFDTFTPLGPAVCTLDEYDDASDVALRTTVDGIERQNARTSQLVFSIPRIISFASRFGELRAGDVILTGTPAGVGHPENRFLSPGSLVQVEVEGVGMLENSVQSE